MKEKSFAQELAELINSYISNTPGRTRKRQPVRYEPQFAPYERRHCSG